MYIRNCSNKIIYYSTVKECNLKYHVIIVFLIGVSQLLAQDKPWQYFGNDSVVQAIMVNRDLTGAYWSIPWYKDVTLQKRNARYVGKSNYGKDLTISTSHIFPTRVPSLEMLALPDKRILYCTDSDTLKGPAIYESTDYGINWKFQAFIQGGIYLSTSAIDRRGVLYLGLERGIVLRSTDLGKSWNYVHHPKEENNDVESILFDSENALYVKTGGGFSNHSISRSTNYGQSWLRLDSLLFSYTNLLDVFYWNSLLIAHNKLYITGSYFDSTKRPQNRLLSCNYNGTNVVDLIRGTDDYDTNRVPMFSIVDSSGAIYSIGSGNSIINSIDSGKTWQRSAYISDRVDNTFTQRIWDTIGVKGLLLSDKLTIMLDGHLHLGHFHYRSRDTVKYMPPQRIASMNRCGYATATFIADTLTSVEFIQAASMNVTVRYDTIVPRRSIQVHVNVIDTSQYAHFLFRATTHKGHKTEWGDDIFPRVQQTELQLRKGKSMKAPDSLDAGFAVNYLWYRDGKKIGYFGSQTYLRYERILEIDTPGTYWCEIFDTTGCVQTTAPYTYNPVSVPEETDAQIKVFPNPANESITIIGIGDIIHDIEITDVLGKCCVGFRREASRRYGYECYRYSRSTKWCV
ncbi:MAG: hypothetical protein U0Y96_05305 [Candidatus Kapaibacterium sp.]